MTALDMWLPGFALIALHSFGGREFSVAFVGNAVLGGK